MHCCRVVAMALLQWLPSCRYKTDSSSLLPVPSCFSNEEELKKKRKMIRMKYEMTEVAINSINHSCFTSSLYQLQSVVCLGEKNTFNN